MLTSISSVKSAKRLLDSLLFDAAFYAEQCGSDIPPGMSPVNHYLRFGNRTCRDPHPLFSTAFYVDKTKLNDEIPLVHYIDSGDAKVSPHPLFDAEYYCSKHPAWKESGLTPLGHYLANAFRTGFDPSPYFDTAHYLSQVAELEREGKNPLLHYLRYGAAQGLDPSLRFQTNYYLDQNPDVRDSDVNPLLHFMRCGRAEGRPHCSPFLVQGKADREELLQSYGRLREIEPLLPRAAQLSALNQIASPLSSRVGDAYLRFAKMIQQPFTHLFFLPSLIHGGAEKVTMNIVRHVVERRGTYAPVVFLTDSSEMPARGWLPEGVRIFSFEDLEADLSAEEQELLLLRLIIQIGPALTLNTNSLTAWRLFRRYGRQLSRYTHLAACLFDYGYDADGVPDGYPIHFLNAAFDDLSCLISDNNQFRAKLIDRFCFQKDDQQKLVVAYTPLEIDGRALASPRTSDTCKHVLWASRLSAGKRPDILLSIARRLPERIFHLWGQADFVDEKILQSLRTAPNIVLHGRYERFSAIPLEAIGAFVYTTQSDGVPLVLLEALAAGLPVVAPRIGGIPEVITDDTGWLVQDFTDIDAYVRAIAHIFAAPDEASMRVSAGQKLLRDRHLWSSFSSLLDGVAQLWEHVQ